MYDINRNLVSRKIEPFTLDNICYVSKSKYIFLKILAGLNLFLFFLIFVFLLII